MNHYEAINDVLVNLFNEILDLEERALITGEYKNISVNDMHGSLTVGYQKKVPAGRIKPAFFVSNFWFLSIVFYCNVL